MLAGVDVAVLPGYRPAIAGWYSGPAARPRDRVIAAARAGTGPAGMAG